MNDLYSQYAALLSEKVRFLPDKPEETANSTLRALWHMAVGHPKSAEQALADALPELDDAGRERLAALVQRRIEGVPLAHISQRQRFMGLEMIASGDALVPRKETEVLAQAVVDLGREVASRQPSLMMLDVCTGSGNVALAAAHYVPSARVLGADLSSEAVALARRNAEHLGLAARTEFRTGDLLAPFDQPEFHGRVDVLSCNPPYISSAKVEHMDAEISAHEPRLAFDGGPFGVNILMRLLQDAPRFLKPGGWLAFEVGLGQGPGMLKRLEKAGGFTEARALNDAHGAPRSVVARYAPKAA